MQECWHCEFLIRNAPGKGVVPKILELTCPRCGTLHFLTEDRDGNLIVAEAVRSDGTVIRVH